jgi:hypothetical protein
MTIDHSASNVGSATVTKSSTPVLPITLSGSSSQSVFPSQAWTLTASSITDLGSSCFVASTISSFKQAFAWSQVLTRPTTFSNATVLLFPLATALLSSIPALQKPTSTLVVAAGTLAANTSYLFRVELTATITFNTGAPPQTLTSSTLVAVSVGSSPLVARIAGGNRNVWVDPAAGACAGQQRDL